MILYVVGDGHTAAAHTSVPYTIAEEEVDRWYAGRIPHPDNEQSSFVSRLQKLLKARLIWEFGSTNQEVFNNCYKFLTQHKTNEDVIVIIGWPEDIADDPEIYAFHKELLEHKIKHLFFTNTVSNDQKDWGGHFVWESYTGLLTQQGFEPNEFGYFSTDAQYFWANHLLKSLTKLI